jgi:L-alanine-DL-glutamate epimerase-like enolase superfamily enzyme
VELRATTTSLALAEEFGIARGSRTTQSVVQVELEHDGLIGRGEAAPVYYRGESVDSARDFLATTAPPLVGDDPFALEAIEDRLEDVEGEAAGKAALDAALHDWIGQKLGVPVWRLLGLSPEAPPTSFTISIDSLEGTRDRARRARELSPRLPVVVDEGCQDLGDVAPAAGYADGINVKLAKSGGVRESVRMIHAARALGLRVMLGCMVESQLGVAPAAAIASLADWVDLDGHLLLADEPFTGLRFEDGRVLPGDGPGLGVAPA